MQEYTITIKGRADRILDYTGGSEDKEKLY